MKKLSIIIPAYNEEKRILKTLQEYNKFFYNKFKNDFEILVIINGSTDNTINIVKEFAEKNKNIDYRDFKGPIRKGGAIIEGFKIAQGSLIGFVDADMATPPSAFYDLAEKINNYDGIIASRWIKNAKIKVKQPFLKRFGSRGFNFLTRILFGLKFKDTQCGAKLFKKQLIKKILNDLTITKWAFDVNLIYSAQKKGFKIIEVPTEWNAIKASHFNLIKAIPEMALGLLRLRLLYSPFKFIVKVYDKMPGFLKIQS